MITRDRTTLREVHPLVVSNLSLWSHGGSYPEPGSDLLRLPFRFQLPDSLPPSFRYSGFQKSASVLYSVTAVGVRPGTFQLNRRIRHPLVVLPKDVHGTQARHAISTSDFKTLYVEEKIRRGLWGDYATARVEVRFAPAHLCIRRDMMNIHHASGSAVLDTQRSRISSLL